MDAEALGRRIRQARDRAAITQKELARRLGVSPSYLNLIEHGRRALPAALLFKLAEELGVDLRELAGSDDGPLLHDLGEVFGDPVLEDHKVGRDDLREWVAAAPGTARAVVHLYRAWVAARTRLQTFTEQATDAPESHGIDRVRLSSEQVSDLIQRHLNHFPELEEAAESLWRDARLDEEDLFSGLARHLDKKLGVRVRIATVDGMGGALRRFDSKRRELRLSELLRRGSRNFQLAHQVGLLTVGQALDRFAADPQLTSDESRALARIALANYLASAVLMPYGEFLRAAKAVRYDLDLLGHRFRSSFEQVCHRLTTLRRPTQEGVRFHMIRIDIAGNISKRFSATGIPFPRFSGLCPLWNVHAAFLQPGFIRTQISKLPDGRAFFSVARTVRKHRGGYQARTVLQAIGLGCLVDEARELVYADGIDLENAAAAVPVGVTCRLCERLDCEARAFPPVQGALRIDQDVLGVSFYAPVGD